MVWRGWSALLLLLAIPGSAAAAERPAIEVAWEVRVVSAPWRNPDSARGAVERSHDTWSNSFLVDEAIRRGGFLSRATEAQVGRTELILDAVQLVPNR